MKLGYFLPFALFLFSSQNHAQHGSNYPPVNNNLALETTSGRSCTQSVSPLDEKLISQFLAESAQLRKSLIGKSLEIQATKLVNTYTDKISPAGLNALSAVYMREQFLQLANGLQNDPAVNKAYKEFNDALDDHAQESKKYRESGILKKSFGIGDGNSLNESGNNLTAKAIAFRKALKTSPKLDEAYKKQIDRSVSETLSAMFSSDSSTAAAFSDRYDAYAATAVTVRNGAAGAGLIVAGILTGGATMSAGGAAVTSTAATLGTTGAMIAGVLSSAAVGAAAGAAGGAGYGLLRGEAGIAARSALSDDSMCALVNERSQHSKQVYKDALHFAAMGAAIGGAAGGLSASGGIYALVARGGGAALATVGAGASAWGASKNGLEAKRLFEEAQVAADNGDEDGARSLIQQSRAKAVEAGLQSIDGVLAGVAAAKTTQAFKSSLKEAPSSVMQIHHQNQIKNMSLDLQKIGHSQKISDKYSNYLANRKIRTNDDLKRAVSEFSGIKQDIEPSLSGTSALTGKKRMTAITHLEDALNSKHSGNIPKDIKDKISFEKQQIETDITREANVTLLSQKQYVKFRKDFTPSEVDELMAAKTSDEFHEAYLRAEKQSSIRASTDRADISSENARIRQEAERKLGGVVVYTDYPEVNIGRPYSPLESKYVKAGVVFSKTQPVALTERLKDPKNAAKILADSIFNELNSQGGVNFTVHSGGRAKNAALARWEADNRPPIDENYIESVIKPILMKKH